MISNPYGIQRRRKGRSTDIDDPEFRSRVISWAGTGLSRRGVAAAVGKTESTIRTWIERGMAYPDVEPWGSFADQYRRAERGLEGAAAGTVAWVVARMHRATRLVDAGEREGASDNDRALAAQALEALAEPQLKELLNVLAARFPEDWGTSKHRKPEPEYDPQNFLDANTMDREQLAALFTDPPDAIKGALQDSAASVYAILLAGGFDPRKATDGSENVSTMGDEPGQHGAGSPHAGDGDGPG